MATLPGQRAQFTWSLNQYNIAEDAETRAKFAKRMARYIRAAPGNNFTVEDVTQGQDYPKTEVEQYLDDPGLNGDGEPEPNEQEALNLIQQMVDTSDIIRVGDGPDVVYAYGYRCAPDRLKIGSSGKEATQRIRHQINTSTPDRPVLFLEIKTHTCRALERAIHATLETRGK